MKKYFLIAVGGFLIVGCNNAGETTATIKDSMNSTKDTVVKEMTDMSDSFNKTKDTASLSNASNLINEFVNKAGSGGMMEVEMGKLAQANGGSDDVRNYGKMLEKDHSEANAKLKNIAEKENIAIPASMLPDQKKHIDHLMMLKGKDFDKAFIPMMIEDHTKDIAEFKRPLLPMQIKTSKHLRLPLCQL
jgi:putative membrane protein